ncbi:hypothetical protein CY34DRAFT_809010, partial [Suillus luteus UH-Slu-Lm8-n1]
MSSALTHREVPTITLFTPSDLLLLHAILYRTMHFDILHIVAALTPAFPGEEYCRWGCYRTRD